MQVRGVCAKMVTCLVGDGFVVNLTLPSNQQLHGRHCFYPPTNPMNLEQLATRATEQQRKQKLDEVVELMADYKITTLDIENHLKSYKTQAERFQSIRRSVAHYGKRVTNVQKARKAKSDRREALLNSVKPQEPLNKPTLQSLEV